MDFSFTQGATGSLVTNGEQRKLMDDPGNEHTYYGHVMDIVNTTFNATYMDPWIDHFDQLVPGQPFFQGFKSYINTRPTTPIGQRRGRRYPSCRLRITTAGPVDVGDATTARVAGTGWVDVRQIRLAGSEIPLPDPLASPNQCHRDGKSTCPSARARPTWSWRPTISRANWIDSATINVTSSGASAARSSLRVSEINYNPADPGQR